MDIKNKDELKMFELGLYLGCVITSIIIEGIVKYFL